MDYYLQYHNVENEGLPLSDPPFTGTYLGIRTSVPIIKGAERRRVFFLAETFVVEDIIPKRNRLAIVQ